MAPGQPVRIQRTGIDGKERTPFIGYIGEVISDGDTVRVTVHGADKFVWDRLGPPPFPPPFSDRVTRPPAFDYWWRRLDWVFDLPDPRSFPPLATTLPDKEHTIVQRYVRVAGDLAHSSLLNSPKENYSYQLPQGPSGPEKIEKASVQRTSKSGSLACSVRPIRAMSRRTSTWCRASSWWHRRPRGMTGMMNGSSSSRHGAMP
jgi:hypothetical protein